MSAARINRACAIKSRTACFCGNSLRGWQQGAGEVGGVAQQFCCGAEELLAGETPESQLVASLAAGEGSPATPRPRRGRRWRWCRGVAVNLQLRRGKPVGGCRGVGGVGVAVNLQLRRGKPVGGCRGVGGVGVAGNLELRRGKPVGDSGGSPPRRLARLVRGRCRGLRPRRHDREALGRACPV
jgi:hypothetical protein